MTFSKRLSIRPLQLVATLFLSIIFSAADSPVQAGRIIGFSWSSAVASIALDPVALPVAPNNDDAVGLSPNQILVTQKAYFGIGPADIVFTVEDSGDATGSVTEYVINEGVDNGTPFDWSAYRIELGFGVGAGFVPSPSGDDLDFDSPDFNTPVDFSAFFTTVSESEDVILASGGLFTIGDFTTPLFRFSIDVPDGITEFTLRQIPIAAIVPEPTSAALLASLGFAVMFSRTRRKK